MLKPTSTLFTSNLLMNIALPIQKVSLKLRQASIKGFSIEGKNFKKFPYIENI